MFNRRSLAIKVDIDSTMSDVVQHFVVNLKRLRIHLTFIYKFSI